MQPPETEPTTCPSSRTASSAPGGRGELPHVLTTVTSSTRLPAASHSALLRSTSRSTLSMRRYLKGDSESDSLVRDSLRTILRRTRQPVDGNDGDDRCRQRESQPQVPLRRRGFVGRR